MDDAIEIGGLSQVLDEDEDLPYLELIMSSRGRSFKAAILAGADEWTVNVRDERGKSVPGSGELYDSQAAAVLAAALIALETARSRIP
jgi:hypothetical protein